MRYKNQDIVSSSFQPVTTAATTTIITITTR
jgi:hypothetical protein